MQERVLGLRVEDTEIPNRLRQMVDLLVDEQSWRDVNTTGVCMEYLLKNGVLGVLVNISEADYPSGIRGETLRTVASMIDLSDEVRRPQGIALLLLTRS